VSETSHSHDHGHHHHGHSHHHETPRSRAEQSERINRYAAYDERRRNKRRMLRNGELDNLEPAVGGTSRFGVLGIAFIVDRIIHKATGTAHGAAMAGAALAENVRNSVPVRAVGRFLNRAVLRPPVRAASRGVVSTWRSVSERPAAARAKAQGRRAVLTPIRNAWSDRRRVVATAPGAAVGAAASAAAFMTGAAMLAGEHVVTSNVARVAAAIAGVRYAMETDLYRVPARHVVDAWRHLPDRLRHRHGRSAGREIAQQIRGIATGVAREWRGGPQDEHHCDHGPGVLRRGVHAVRNRRRTARGEEPLPPLADYTPPSVEDNPPRGQRGVPVRSLAATGMLAERIMGRRIRRGEPDADLFRDLQTVLMRGRVRASEPFGLDDDGPRFWITTEGGAREMAVVLGKLHQRSLRRGEVPPRFNLQGFSAVVAMHTNAAVRHAQLRESTRIGRLSLDQTPADVRKCEVYEQIDATFGSPDDFDERERIARGRLARVLTGGRPTRDGVRVDAVQRRDAFQALRVLTGINGMEVPGVVDLFEPGVRAHLQRDLRLVAQRRAAEVEEADPYVGRHRAAGQRERPAVCTDECHDHELTHDETQAECEHPHHEHEPAQRHQPGGAPTRDLEIDLVLI
jgi:hypothetical protein